jgi:predicted aspartyl protease
MKQEIKTTQSKTVSFTLKENKIVLPLVIKDKNYNFIFDTGASTSIITDKSIITNQLDTNKLVKLPDNTKIKVKEAVYNVNFGILKSTNKVFNTVYVKKNICDTLSNSGILGVDFFSLVSQEKIIELNFDNSRITLISKKEKIKSNFPEYTEVKSHFSMLKTPSIFLSLDGISKPKKFLFDTGFDYGLHIKSKYLDIVVKDSMSVFYGISPLVTIDNMYSSKKHKSIYFYNLKIEFNNSKIKMPITTSSKIKLNIVGMEFIKKFNWILDFKNKKIYASKNKNYNSILNFNSIIFNKKEIIFDIIKNELTIISKKMNIKKYNIGDKTTHVDGVRVTNKNICHLLKRINKDNSLNLETKSP